MSLVLFSCTGIQAAEDAESKEIIKVAILTGQNNHAWMDDSPVLKNIFDDAEIFETTILQAPDKNDPEKATKWQAFKPDFKAYDVIVLNYNGEMWPEHLRESWLNYIAEGGKVMSFHAGNNPFKGWSEFEKMIGLLWRGSDHGKRIYIDSEGNQQVLEAGEGPGAGHGRRHPFLVDTNAPDNPIFKDLPEQWMHAKDELYHGQRGPAENMTILMSAFSSKESRGTGVKEPVIWTIPYGKGLVMTNVLGHWWKSPNDFGESLQCAGMQTILTRSAQWLATGEVTLPVPDDFPTKDKVSMRELKPYEPLAYIYVKGVPGSDPLASCGCSMPCDPARHPLLDQYAAMREALPGYAEASSKADQP